MAVSINEIKPDLLKNISKIAKREGVSETKVLNEVLKIGIEIKTKSKIPNFLIGNKDTYNPDPERLMGSAGFIKGYKPFDAMKLVEEMRRGS
ncbi:MAG: hypothetical protein FWH29_01325 [Methanobrevibacter sp.]|nr:hypothetical protein [Methanobrevibacter sp.]